jgi:hypothetical protein
VAPSRGTAHGPLLLPAGWIAEHGARALLAVLLVGTDRSNRAEHPFASAISGTRPARPSAPQLADDLKANVAPAFFELAHVGAIRARLVGQRGARPRMSRKTGVFRETAERGWEIYRDGEPLACSVAG